MPLTPKQFETKWDARFPNNDDFLIESADLREFAHDVARRGPNQENSLWKAVRFMTRAEAVAAATDGEVFEELDFTTCCLFTSVWVEFYRPTPTSPVEYGVVLRAAYDGGPNPKYRIQRTAGFAEPILLPAKFVKADSAAGRQANIPFYKAGTDYAVADAVQFTNGPTLVYLAKQAGKLPAPSAVAGDAYWEPTVPAVAEVDFAQLVTVLQARQLAATGTFKVGRLYILSQRVDTSNAALDDVRIRALTTSELEPEGYEMRGPGQQTRMAYDLARDETTELAAPAAGSSSQAIFTGADPATGTVTFQLPAGASHNLADYQLVITTR